MINSKETVALILSTNQDLSHRNNKTSSMINNDVFSNDNNRKESAKIIYNNRIYCSNKHDEASSMPRGRRVRWSRRYNAAKSSNRCSSSIAVRSNST